MSRPRVPAALALAAFTGLLLAPFLDKPYHIDDALYLRAARQIRTAPSAPFGFSYNWSGTPVPYWLVNLNPPLHAYVLAAITAATGERELPTHAALLVFPLGCAALMHGLARRWCAEPASAAAAAVVSPAFLVGATSAMADLPLLFFWLLSVRLTVAAADRDRPWLLFPAGLAATAAALTKYFGAALVPLLCVYWCARRTRPWRQLWALALPAAALAGWSAYSVAKIGFAHPLASAGYAAAEGRDWGFALGAGAAYLGGCLLFPVAALPAAAAAGRRPAALWAAALAILVLLIPEGFAAAAGPLWLPLAAGGVLALLLVLREAAAWRDPESRLLFLWSAGTLVFALAANWTINARTLLPASFPVAVLLVRWAQSRPRSGALLLGLRCALAPAGVVSLLLAWSDYGHARAVRDFAENHAPREARADGRVLFAGHWGFQHYMERAGASALDYGKLDLRPGDLLCVSVNNAGVRPLPEPLRSRLRRVGSFPAPARLSLRLTDNFGRTAGFYSSVFGPLPFSASGPRLHDLFLVEELAGYPPA